KSVRGLGIHTVAPHQITKHVGRNDPRITSVLCFPYPGEGGFCRDKVFPTNLKDKDGRGMRYLQRGRSGCRLYVPLPLLPAGVLQDVTVPVRITEGEKKAAKVCQEGCPCLALGGLWNFSKDGELISGFDALGLSGREIILDPDGEVWERR